MGDSQENNKGKSRNKDNYVSWTVEDTNELLHLLVDAMNRGLRDANGSLSKQNVERIILPQLNAKTKFPKTYSHYLSRMKWFRNQYNMMSTLMRNNSGFGWDPIGKISNMMEKREKDRDRDRELEGIIWDVIKEIPNLDDITRFKTAELLNTKAKKDFFLKMSPEERSSWINFKLGNN
ncbi:Uncharacterized protein HKD37_01G001711 [Glycine soja]